MNEELKVFLWKESCWHVLISMEREWKERSIRVVGFVVEYQKANYNKMISTFKQFDVKITLLSKYVNQCFECML